MDEEQFAAFLQQAFELAAREDAVIGRTDQVFLDVMARIRQLVESLPDDLLREQAWRQMLLQVQAELEPYATSFSSELFEELADMAPDAAAGAVRLARIPAPSVVFAQQLPETIQAIMNTKVGTRRLSGLFRVQGEETISAFVRDHLSVIDRTVKTGILEGLPTQEIADQIAVVYAKAGKEYVSTRASSSRNAARTIRANSRAIARTAIQDANRQVKDVVYKANSEALKDLRWEWVAALDSRTCPTCAPLDGRTWKTRSAAPTWPAHINCRCQVVPVDPDEDVSIRTGQQVSPEKFTWRGKTWDQLNTSEKRQASSEAGLYASKIKVKGRKLNRRARDVKPGKDGKTPNYADYLAQSDRVTRQMFFGGGNAGSVRSQQFQKKLDAGLSPDKALRELINTSKGVGYFKPVNSL